MPSTVLQDHIAAEVVAQHAIAGVNGGWLA